MTSVLQNGLALLRAPAIEIGFALRSLLRWSRGAPALAQTSCTETFAWAETGRRVELRERAGDLLERYDLGHLNETADPAVRCGNLARLEQLEALARGLSVPCGPDSVVRAADFGCGDFHYAAALVQWLARFGLASGEQSSVGPREVVLRGIELDGHGIYRDGHSRADHARARAAAASTGSNSVRFEVADAAFVSLPEQDVVSLFFPFLTVYASLSWGAPLSRLRPRRLLERAVLSLRPGGWLVVANQTSREHVLLTRYLAKMPVVRIARVPFATDLVPDAERTESQVGSLWLRQE
ncbi:MAG: SAM-dependent methyltransferase [Planctomycetota bacterium]|jgi:SAM-dependent methyltransferase